MLFRLAFIVSIIANFKTFSLHQTADKLADLGLVFNRNIYAPLDGASSCIQPHGSLEHSDSSSSLNVCLLQMEGASSCIQPQGGRKTSDSCLHLCLSPLAPIHLSPNKSSLMHFDLLNNVSLGLALRLSTGH